MGWGCMNGRRFDAWTEGPRDAWFSERKDELVAVSLKRKKYFSGAFVLI
jgi:hypothetical protein